MKETPSNYPPAQDGQPPPAQSAIFISDALILDRAADPPEEYQPLYQAINEFIAGKVSPATSGLYFTPYPKGVCHNA